MQLPVLDFRRYLSLIAWLSVVMVIVSALAIGAVVHALGGGLIGAAIGLLTVLLRQRLDDPVLNTTISFAVPFLAYSSATYRQVEGTIDSIEQRFRRA